MAISKGEKISHQPLYIQIKDTLKQQILGGEYAPYERMPSESELMSTFSVSRITVRQALRDLHSEGLIFTAQGKGTFASKPKATQEVHYLEGFAEAMNPKGYETSAKVLGIREITPNKDVQERLDIQGKDGVIEVVRVRYLNREPVSVDTSYFPVEIGQRLFSKDLSGDIFPLLENELKTPLGLAEISLEARQVDSDTAKLLNMEPGNPIMWVQRLTRDIHGKPVDYEYLAFKGDSYKYHFQVERDPQRSADTHEDKK